MSRLTLLVLYPIAIFAWLTSILMIWPINGSSSRFDVAYNALWGWLGDAFAIYQYGGTGDGPRLLVVWLITALVFSTWIRMIHVANARMRVKQFVEEAVNKIMHPYVGGLKEVISVPAVAERLQQQVNILRGKSAEAAEVLETISTTLYGKSKFADIPDLIGHARVLQKKAEGIEATLDVDTVRVIELREAVTAVEETIRTIEGNIDDTFTAGNDIAELEQRLEELVTRVPEVKITETIATVKVLTERVGAYGTLVQSVVHDPLGDGTDLDDTLRGLERELESFENADIEGELGRLTDIETRLSIQTERFKDHEGIISRLRESIGTTGRLVNISERVLQNPLGTEKPDLEDTLRDLEDDLEKLENTDLEDPLGTLVALEQRLAALKAALTRQTSSLHAVA